MPPHACRLPAADVAQLASIGSPYCDTGRCQEPPAWVIWHWWTRQGKKLPVEVFLCEGHLAAYRHRRADIEIRTFEESR